MSAQGISAFWVTVIGLGSAAIGAIVSALVTAGFNYFGQRLGRDAKRKEILLSKAIELAIRRTDVGLRMAEKMGRNVIVQDDLTLAAVYFRDLEHLINTGDLPAKTKTIAEESLRKAREWDAALKESIEQQKRKEQRQVEDLNDRLGR